MKSWYVPAPALLDGSNIALIGWNQKKAVSRNVARMRIARIVGQFIVAARPVD